jgi:predicted nucleic acid-binding Zn finger protein
MATTMTAAATMTDKATGNVYDLYTVQGSKGATYYVYVRGGQAVHCSCPDRKFRGVKAGKACKHMKAFQVELNAVAAPVAVAEVVTTHRYSRSVLAAHIAEHKAAAQASAQGTIEADLSPFLQTAMSGKSKNGQLSGHAA